MSYQWTGVKKLSFEIVRQMHENNKLYGCMLLYDDNTESYVDEDYKWEDILKHYENGGEFGIEI